ncbi:MAG TPA: histidine phosphatase family protein [Euzebyales bacterium]
MPADRILLIRHAQSQWNAEGRWQGQQGPGLSALGHRQAEATAAFLSARADDVRSLVSSDLPRVTETAAPTARALGLPLETDTRLREIDVGWWSGLTTHEVVARDGDRMAEIRDGADLPRGGAESVADLRARVAPAVDELAAAHDGGTILVFCHGGPVRAVVGALLGLSIVAERALAGPDNCSRTVVLHRGDHGSRLHRYNDTAHLVGVGEGSPTARYG